MSNKPLTDPEFERPVTLRQAYLIMHKFLQQQHSHGPGPGVAGLLGALALLPDGGAADSACSLDCLTASETVLNAEAHGKYEGAKLRVS